MKRYHTIILLLMLTMTTWAQETDKLWQYNVRIGVNIGGNSPIPLPEEIREIKSYSPTFAPSIEAQLTRRLSSHWGIQTGIKLEKKGMETKARVKNYRTEIIENNNKLKGYWTGNVHTEANGLYLSMPILGRYKVNNRFNVKAGIFFSYLIDGDFNGYVNNGYLRKDTPIGDKVVFDDDTRGTYDFSDEMRDFIWGIQAGVDFFITDRINLLADLTWGISDTMKEGFNTISFDMYPIYLNIGAGYSF